MVLKTIDRALELGISPVKLNCVVIKNLNDIEVLDFVELTRDKPIEVRFIEFMPFDGIQISRRKVNAQGISGISQRSYLQRRYWNEYEKNIHISNRYLLSPGRHHGRIIYREHIWVELVSYLV